MYIFLLVIFVLSPAYQWRFKIAGLPTNFLELLLFAFFAAFAVWILYKKELEAFWNFIKSRGWWMNLLIALFLTAGVISAIISPDHQRAAGQLLVYFLQPIATFYMAGYLLQDDNKKIIFVRVIYVTAALFSLYAIIQYFTLIGVPPQWWGNSIEPKRSLSVFEYPNAYALWLDALMAFMLPFAFSKKLGSWQFRLLYLLSIGGLLLSFSRGGWAALLGAAVVFSLFFVDKSFAGVSGKKIKIAMLSVFAVLVMVVAYYPNLRYRVLLPFLGDKSTLSRTSLWRDAADMLKTSPVLGKGLYGFYSNYQKFNVDLTLPQALNYPHNIFLNFWVETGLLGLITFLLISATAVLKALGDKKDLYSIGLVLFFVAIYIHGMDDAPYFLNNLALVFWMILALATTKAAKPNAPPLPEKNS